jgi:hypothetical protein
MHMKTTCLSLLLSVVFVASICTTTLTGCDSCSGPDLEWRSHSDTFSIYPEKDTFKFSFEAMRWLLQSPETVYIVHDTSLVDSVRIELNLNVRVTHSSIYRSLLLPQWSNDTLTILFGYNSKNIIAIDVPPTSTQGHKRNSQTPQCTPIEDGDDIKLLSAKVFLPPGKEAIYIGH